LRLPFGEDATGEIIGEYDEIDLPEVKPIIRRHRRLSCRCETCGKATSAPVPHAALGTPFGRRIHALVLDLKSNQLFSYQRLQGVFSDLFGLDISEGALTNMFKRAVPAFAARRDDALVALRRAQVVACDETGCGSKAATAINGSSARPMPSFIPPCSAAPLRSFAMRWPGTSPTSGYRIAILASRGMGCTTRLALLISIARLASSSSTAPTLSVRAPSSGSIVRLVLRATLPRSPPPP